MRRALLVLVIVGLGAAAAWSYLYRRPPTTVFSVASAPPSEKWLDNLYSQNPRDVETASHQVQALGPRALPLIQKTLRDPESEAERIKAALKACGILGQQAAPAIPEVASVLAEPGVTAEAALALSYMGPEALATLRDAMSSDDPIVRRESLRSIGKLRERAPLQSGAVVPLLVSGMRDADQGVRAVAATYLGIIHESAETAVPVLIGGLTDVDPEVRAASAAALGEFGDSATPAVPNLRKAAGDRNEDVAREAGLALVKLQTQKEPKAR